MTHESEYISFQTVKARLRDVINIKVEVLLIIFYFLFIPTNVIITPRPIYLFTGVDQYQTILMKVG